jgi:hypothetical protein
VEQLVDWSDGEGWVQVQEEADWKMDVMVMPTSEMGMQKWAVRRRQEERDVTRLGL